MDAMNHEFSQYEKLYSFIIRRGVVNRSELKKYTKEELNNDYNYLYRKFLFKLIQQGKVEKIKSGLFFARNIYLNRNEVPSKYLIGSRIRSNYYLGYHTALELFGSAQSIHNGCHISVTLKDRFKRFNYSRFQFNPVVTDNLSLEIETRNIENNEIRVSSPSRTFVECIHRPDLCVGYEEVYKSLESLGGVDINGVFNILMMYDTDILFRSVGFFLEELKERSPYYSQIDDKDLKKIEKNIGNSRSYLIRGQKGEYISKWKLYIPERFKELFQGVR